jgi:hypothetical protein
MLVAKKSVIAEINAFLKSLYLNRTGYPGHYRYRYYEPDGVSHGGSVGAEPSKKKEKIFGKEIKGVKGKAAIEKVLENKNGYVEGAFYKDEIGNIDIVYGKVINAERHTGYGLAHIVDKHPEMTPEIMEEIIKNGKVSKTHNGYNIEYKEYILGINKGFKDEKTREYLTTDNWIVTSFEKDKRGKGKGTIASAASFTPETTGSSNLSSSSTISPVPESVKKSLLEQTKEILKAIGA